VTDRFAQDFDSLEPCEDQSSYCGGTWKGITRKLNYIKHMGFDTIAISPIVKNFPNGYHGLWAQVGAYLV